MSVYFIEYPQICISTLGMVAYLHTYASLIGYPDCPVAVIERATRPDQRVVRGSISTICPLVRAAHLQSPATIVIGDVVNALEDSSADCNVESMLGHLVDDVVSKSAPNMDVESGIMLSENGTLVS